jgi:hypothetical protein
VSPVDTHRHLQKIISSIEKNREVFLLLLLLLLLLSSSSLLLLFIYVDEDIKPILSTFGNTFTLFSVKLV